MSSIETSCDQAAGHFTATHWSQVLQAARDQSPQAATALDKLCRTYWFPLYAFVRRQGYGVADAQDLTQEFFARFLKKNFLASVDREKGKFRSFLLAAMKHFLANEWDRLKAEKRGGRQQFISIDGQETEQRYQLEPASDENPEQIFDRRWALTVLDQALGRLKEQYAADGKEAQFGQLKRFLSNEANEKAYATAAVQLQMTPGAVTVAVHRLRQHYRNCLRAEIAQTVSSPGDLDDEMRHLFGVVNQ
jgi:RNA polymerase sigma-70 factor (ECF subfamily)